MTMHPVTPEMSNPSYNKPDACADMRKRKGAITNFFKRAAPAKRKLDEGEGGSARTAAGVSSAGSDAASCAPDGAPARSATAKAMRMEDAAAAHPKADHAERKMETEGKAVKHEADVKAKGDLTHSV